MKCWSVEGARVCQLEKHHTGRHEENGFDWPQKDGDAPADPINPDHCIAITRHMGFNAGNAIKYLWRAGKKPHADAIEDLKKAVWYIEDEIKRLEAK